jgi:hypothetical protein
MARFTWSAGFSEATRALPLFAPAAPPLTMGRGWLLSLFHLSIGFACLCYQTAIVINALDRIAFNFLVRPADPTSVRRIAAFHPR